MVMVFSNGRSASFACGCTSGGTPAYPTKGGFLPCFDYEKKKLIARLLPCAYKSY